MRKSVLSKVIGWILLTILVFIDAVLDMIRGAEGNPLWKPVVNVIGTDNVILLAPFVLIIFFIVIKIGSRIVEKIDKTPHAEELILTAVVIAYAVYDIWVISVDFLGFRLITNFRIMMIPMGVIAIVYALWAERKLKVKK